MVKSTRRHSLVGMFIGGNNHRTQEMTSKCRKARAWVVQRSNSSDGLPHQQVGGGGGKRRLARRASLPSLPTATTTTTKTTVNVSSGATAEMTEPESPNISYQKSICEPAVPPSPFFANNASMRNTAQRRPTPTNPRVLYTRRLSESSMCMTTEEDNVAEELMSLPVEEHKTTTNTSDSNYDDHSMPAFEGSYHESSFSMDDGAGIIDHPFYGLAKSDSCLSYNADDDNEEDEEGDDQNNMLSYASQDEDMPPVSRRRPRRLPRRQDPSTQQPQQQEQSRPQLQGYKQYSNRSLLSMCGTNVSGDEGVQRSTPRRFSMGSVASMESKGNASFNNSGHFNYDGNTSETPQTVLVPKNIQHQNQSKGKGMSSSKKDRRVVEAVEVVELKDPNFELIMTIVSSWEAVKQLDCYQEILAEQILLRMMELDPNTRHELKLPSLLYGRERFKVLQEALMSILDGFMSFLGPAPLSEFHEEMSAIGERYQSDGFRQELWTPSVVEGLRFLLEPDFPTELEKGWETILNYLVSKMK